MQHLKVLLCFSKIINGKPHFWTGKQTSLDMSNLEGINKVFLSPKPFSSQSSAIILIESTSLAVLLRRRASRQNVDVISNVEETEAEEEEGGRLASRRCEIQYVKVVE